MSDEDEDEDGNEDVLRIATTQLKQSSIAPIVQVL